MIVFSRAAPRALVLGFSSKWAVFRPPFVKSHRSEVIARIKPPLVESSRYYALVVTGPTGVGKTAAIDTAMAGRPGVVRVNISPAGPYAKILEDSLKAVAGSFSLPDVDHSASDVIKWHKRFFSVPPTILLRLRERLPEEKIANVSGAARTLTETYGLSVIVECPSDRDLLSSGFCTDRHHYHKLQVDPAEREVLEEIPEFQLLIEALRKEGIADLVWAVFGGYPALYNSLKLQWEHGNRGDLMKLTEGYLLEVLQNSTQVLREAQRTNPLLRNQVYSRFKTEDSICEFSTTFNFQLPSPDPVLRVVKAADYSSLLVPVTPAMALALRYSEGGEFPSLDIVRQVLARGSRSSDKAKGEAVKPVQEEAR